MLNFLQKYEAAQCQINTFDSNNICDVLSCPPLMSILSCQPVVYNMDADDVTTPKYHPDDRPTVERVIEQAVFSHIVTQISCAVFMSSKFHISIFFICQCHITTNVMRIYRVIKKSSWITNLQRYSNGRYGNKQISHYETYPWLLFCLSFTSNHGQRQWCIKMTSKDDEIIRKWPLSVRGGNLKAKAQAYPAVK